ncbi:MAG: inositol-3-phosphate synthase [Candidatus Wallbacteria bacterium]|nr:inositol-3-phosphate synthase [Candidatus Wallbacteria bacterium]
MLVGLGALASTLVAGIEAIVRGLARPIGSLTQLYRCNGDANNALLLDVLPMAKLQNLEFAAWDVYPDNAFQSAVKAAVLHKDTLELLRGRLEELRPFKAVVDGQNQRRLKGQHVKTGTRLEQAQELEREILAFKEARGLDRMVLVLCNSTEITLEMGEEGQSIKKFEQGLKADCKTISASMIYSYVAIKLGIPVVNCTPSQCLEVPALARFAEENGVPVAGKDLKTGQTLLKTILAPGIKARYLGLTGWYSTNILGNRDGEVLDDPEASKTKVNSKLSVLESILEPERHPELYRGFYHKVKIDYYPPRGDNKEAWDNVDIFGWMDYPMQIKVNFLCRDSILAAPLVLDLVLLLDLAGRTGWKGIQDWLGFFFKSPLLSRPAKPIHDLFQQHGELEEALLRLRKPKEPVPVQRVAAAVASH